MSTKLSFGYKNMNEEARLVLRFEGPFGLTREHDRILFDEQASRQFGIYLWTVPSTQGGLLITYVGETGGTFWQRLKDHMIQTAGGNYQISDPDLLSQGIRRILWNGLWRKGTRDKMPEYLEYLVDLAPVITRSLALAHVFLAPFDSERRLRQRIEGALANHIKNQPAPTSSLLPEDVRYYRRRKGEDPILVHVQCAGRVLGLPCDLEA